MKGSFDDRNGAPIAESERWRWSSHKKFFMAVVAANEGVVNIYQFPTEVLHNGFVWFLFPYILLKVFFVMPITFMQLAMGQFSEKGPVSVWILCPLLQGLGYAIVILGVDILVFNNSVITYSMYYLYSSFQSQLPWTHCDHVWAKENCMVRLINATVTANCVKKHGISYCKNIVWESSAQHFWVTRALGYVPGVDLIKDGMGTYRVGIIVCLFLSCFLLFLVTSRGLKNIEKIVNFTTFYPLACIAILLLTTFFDVGASNGLSFFFLEGEKKHIARYTAWVRAYDMAIQSTGLGVGMLYTMGSYCTFRSPANMDAILFNLIDIFTTIVCGLLSFNCMGIIGHHFALHLGTLVNTDNNLAFVVIPEALTLLRGSSHFWSLLYFSSIFCFGFSTQCMILTSNLSVIYDRFPITTRHTVFVSAGANIVLFLLGLPLCTTNGAIYGHVFEPFISGVLQVSVLVIQLLAVMWIYGVGRLSDDFHFMLGFRPSNFFQACWFLAPLITILILIYEYKIIEVKLSVVNADIALISWMVIYCVPMGIVALIAIVNLIIYFKEDKLRHVLKPVAEWGPVDPVLMKSRRMFSAQAMTKEYLYRQSRLGAHAHSTQYDTDSEHD